MYFPKWNSKSRNVHLPFIIQYRIILLRKTRSRLILWNTNRSNYKWNSKIVRRRLSSRRLSISNSTEKCETNKNSSLPWNLEILNLLLPVDLSLKCLPLVPHAFFVLLWLHFSYSHNYLLPAFVRTSDNLDGTN